MILSVAIDEVIALAGSERNTVKAERGFTDDSEERVNLVSGLPGRHSLRPKEAGSLACLATCRCTE